MIELLALVLFFVIFIGWIPYAYSTTKKGAPFVPLEPEVVEEVMKLAQVKKGDVFYDLGSGDGRLVIAAALRGAQAFGIETDTLRVFYSRLWLKALRLKNAEIIKDDIFKTDLSKATVVSAYLLPETMEKLKEVFKNELKKGTRVVSVAFLIPGLKPVKISPRGTIYGPVYYYKI